MPWQAPYSFYDVRSSLYLLIEATMKYNVVSVCSTNAPYRISGTKDIYSALKCHINVKTEHLLCIILMESPRARTNPWLLGGNQG